MQRRSTNKRRSVRSFNRREKRSHPFNFAVMRGGWRL